MPSLRLNPALKKQNKLLSAPIPPVKKAKKTLTPAPPCPAPRPAPPPDPYTITWRVSFSKKLVYQGLLTLIDFNFTDFASKEAHKVSEFTEGGDYTIHCHSGSAVISAGVTLCDSKSLKSPLDGPEHWDNINTVMKL